MNVYQKKTGEKSFPERKETRRPRYLIGISFKLEHWNIKKLSLQCIHKMNWLVKSYFSIYTTLNFFLNSMLFSTSKLNILLRTVMLVLQQYKTSVFTNYIVIGCCYVQFRRYCKFRKWKEECKVPGWKVTGVRVQLQLA